MPSLIAVPAVGPPVRRASPATLRWVALSLCVVLGAIALGGCSIKRMAVKSVANSLTSGPDTFASDDDPELVRDALPFGLKLMESLLAMVPDHRGLLLTCCRGYTQYSFAFVQGDAEALDAVDRERADQLRARALKLYQRALGFGLRGLELEHQGIGAELRRNPAIAVARLKKKELPLVYWTAAAWGSAIAVARDQPEVTADIDAVRALMSRALALDERYEGGVVHEAMIVLESLPAMMGGSPARAREHFQRAIDLSQGARAAPYVALAENLSVAEQKRGEFERLLRQALAIDPERNPLTRLETVLVQRRARLLLSRTDDLFLEADSTQTEESR